MGRKAKKEAVTATFHYVVRVDVNDNDEPIDTKIGMQEFHDAMQRLAAMPAPDLSTQEAVDKLRFSTTVPIFGLSLVEPDLYFGMYKGVYTGHTYENTARGIIPYNSASLRQFYFIVYRSASSGRVYIGTQYLGNFGSYTELKNTITRSFTNKKGLDVRSFRNTYSSFQKVDAQEIVVEYMRSGENAGASNTYGRGPKTVVLKKSGDGLDFASETRKRLFSKMSGPVAEIKAEVAKILSEAELVTVSDNDILNCTVIAQTDGKTKTYHFINESIFATPFPISVLMTVDGHPDPAQLKPLMIKLLKEEILKKAENV